MTRSTESLVMPSPSRVMGQPCLNSTLFAPSSSLISLAFLTRSSENSMPITWQFGPASLPATNASRPAPHPSTRMVSQSLKANGNGLPQSAAPSDAAAGISARMPSMSAFWISDMVVFLLHQLIFSSEELLVAIRQFGVGLGTFLVHGTQNEVVKKSGEHATN